MSRSNKIFVLAVVASGVCSSIAVGLTHRLWAAPIVGIFVGLIVGRFTKDIST